MSTLQIPQKITAGDSFKITGSIDDYRSDTWTATLYLTGGEKISIVATADGTGYQLYKAAADTVSWTAGIYNFALTVSDGTDTYSIESGQLEIVQRADLQATGDKTSHAQKVLIAIEATIEGRASLDQSSYSIAGRSLSRMSIDELLKFRDYYKKKVNEQKNKYRIKTRQLWLK